MNNTEISNWIFLSIDTNNYGNEDSTKAGILVSRWWSVILFEVPAIKKFM